MSCLRVCVCALVMLMTWVVYGFSTLWCVGDVSRDLCMAVCIVGIVRIVSM